MRRAILGNEVLPLQVGVVARPGAKVAHAQAQHRLLLLLQGLELVLFLAPLLQRAPPLLRPPLLVRQRRQPLLLLLLRKEEVVWVVVVVRMVGSGEEVRQV